MFDLIYVFLTDILALLAVIDVVASDSRCDGEEYEPIS